jgi:hypothetical protein
MKRNARMKATNARNGVKKCAIDCERALRIDELRVLPDRMHRFKAAGMQRKKMAVDIQIAAIDTSLKWPLSAKNYGVWTCSWSSI